MQYNQMAPHKYRVANAPTGAGLCALKGGREYMEDRTFYATWVVPTQNRTIPESARTYELYGVLDGHGGDFAVKYVQRWLPWIVAQYVCVALHAHGVPPPNTLSRTLQRAFVSLQEQMRVYNDTYLRTGGVDGFDVCGTTVCVMLRNARYGYVANLGDSRAILCIEKKEKSVTGHVVALTADHKPNGKKEKERILALGGTIALDGPVTWRVEPVGLATSRSLGDLDSRILPNGKHLPRGVYLVSPLPDITVVDLSVLARPSSGVVSASLVFATDGVWDDIDSPSACRIVNGAKGAHSAARALAQAALAKGSQDNITALVVPVVAKKRGTRKKNRS